MPSTLRRFTPIALIAAGAPHSAVAAGGAPAAQPANPPAHELSTWLEQFPVPGSQLHQTMLARLFEASETLDPFSGQPVVAIAIDGVVQFTSGRGLVRVVAVDDQLNEHLVFETYSRIAPATRFELHQACSETCVLPATIPSSLRIEVVDASLVLQTVVTSELTDLAARASSAARSAEQMQALKDAQQKEAIDALNTRIAAQQLAWVGGDTEFSRLSYAEKKRLLACGGPDGDPVFNLQGAEYYKGGIFEITTDQTAALPLDVAPSSLIESFDWRERHGANRPGSPYYDGDSTGGGWFTSVKRQLCGDCWAHSALGATEAIANLYYNQHIDLDLSEQARQPTWCPTSTARFRRVKACSWPRTAPSRSPCRCQRLGTEPMTMAGSTSSPQARRMPRATAGRHPR